MVLDQDVPTVEFKFKITMGINSKVFIEIHLLLLTKHRGLKLLFPQFKGSSDQRQFVFEIIIGKRRIHHRTVLKMNFQIEFQDSKSIADDAIQIHCRSISDPTISAIDFKSIMVWISTILKSCPVKLSNLDFNICQFV